MKIIMFSINPVFPDVVTGGASKHLYHISKYLGSLGHHVQIICAKPDQSQESFFWAENVQVFPVLPFKQPFPQPYAIHGGDLSLVVRRMTDALKGADRFYLHDGEFLIPDVYQAVPTITSFRDNIYPESVLGSFIGKFDDVICVSEFSASVIRSTVGQFYPDLYQRLHVINNGIDINTFTPTNGGALARSLGVDPEHERIILHPHRPEPGKGLPETIKVAYRLIRDYGFEDLRVIVPEWIDTMISGEETDFYHQMMSLLSDLGIREHFTFMPWLSQSQMPALYSLGEVTLCLGNIVEAFGNVAYESLACGTPSIVARVGVHRSLLPEDAMIKVDYGDIQTAAEEAVLLLKAKTVVSPNVHQLIENQLNFKKQVNAYAKIIINCQKRARLAFVPPVPRSDQRYQLAPWCGFSGDRLYHDFRGLYDWLPQLSALIREKDTFTQEDALQRNASEAEWDQWIEDTWIVPVS